MANKQRRWRCGWHNTYQFYLIAYQPAVFTADPSLPRLIPIKTCSCMPVVSDGNLDHSFILLIVRYHHADYTT